MARAMNVDKRITHLLNVVERLTSTGEKVQGIADELLSTFKEVRTPEGKKARDAAKKAAKLAQVLDRATNIDFST